MNSTYQIAFFKSLWILATTFSVLDHAYASDMHDNTVTVYGAVNTYTFKSECDSCKIKINVDDKIKCCFICKLMFCKPCLYNNAHEEHHHYS